MPPLSSCSPRRRVALAALCALLVVGGPRLADAYVLPGDFLCRLVANGRKPSMRDAIITWSVEREEGAPKTEARWYLKRPDRMRQVWVVDGNEQVHILRGGQSYVGDANDQKPQGPSHNLLPLLLFPGGSDLDEMSELVHAGLSQAGLDANTTALARYKDGFAYILGGEAREVSKPQLWLDKVAFLPVRLLWPTGTSPADLLAAHEPAAADEAPALAANANGPMAPASEWTEPPRPVHEWRLSKYAAGLPRQVEEWHDGKRLYRAEAVHVLLNQRLTEDLFEPGAYRPTPPEPVAPPATPRRGKRRPR